MTRVIKVKYKKAKGVFEPLEPVDLPEDEVGEVTVPERANEDDADFLASLGSWRDLLPDPEGFIREIYEARIRGSRPPVDLE